MKNILIVVDVQNGFSRYDQAQNVVAKIIDLTNGDYFDTIIATRFINSEDSPYTEILNWRGLMSSPDIDLVEGVNADIVIDKRIYTCVDLSFINLLAKNNDGKKPEKIFICGFDTDCCVLKIATDLFEHEIMPLVLLEYCNSNGGVKSHEAGRLVMKRLIGRKCLVDHVIESKSDIALIIKERA